MRRLRPILVSVLLLSFFAPGVAALGSELHLSLRHSRAHEHGHDGESEDFGWIPVHGHHHTADDPEHGHPALVTRSLRAADARPGEVAAPSPSVAASSAATGHATTLVPVAGRAGPDLRRLYRAAGGGPPDTLFSASCSLLL